MPCRRVAKPPKQRLEMTVSRQNRVRRHSLYADSYLRQAGSERQILEKQGIMWRNDNANVYVLPQDRRAFQQRQAAIRMALAPQSQYRARLRAALHRLGSAKLPDRRHSPRRRD